MDFRISMKNDTKRFLKILTHSDDEYRLVLNQGWDECDNIHEWSKTLSPEELDQVILGAKDLLLLNPSALQEYFNSLDFEPKQRILSMSAARVMIIHGLTSMVGFIDRKFLLDVLSRIPLEDEYYTQRAIIHGLCPIAPPEVAEILRVRLDKLAELWRSHPKDKSGEARRIKKEIAGTLAYGMGKLAGNKSVRYIEMCLEIDSILHVTDGVTGSLFCGMSTSRLLWVATIKSQLDAEILELSNSQQKLLRKMFRNHFNNLEKALLAAVRDSLHVL